MTELTQERVLIYGREGTKGHFYPVGSRGLVKNRVHASQFIADGAPAALESLRADNPGWEFHLRTWKGKRIKA